MKKSRTKKTGAKTPVELYAENSWSFIGYL